MSEMSNTYNIYSHEFTEILKRGIKFDLIDKV